MAYSLEDVLSGGDDGRSSKAGGHEVRLPCALGDKCNHATVDECDEYRQQLLYEEHKEKCPDGENCQHFSTVKGIPSKALWRGESPAEFLKRTRGV